MKVQEIKAKNELSKYIEGYWNYSSENSEKLLLFPDGTFNVLFASEPFSINQNKQFAKGTYLIPLLTNIQNVQSEGELVGIRYKAFALKNVIGFNTGQAKDICELSQLSNQKSILTKMQNELETSGDFGKLKDLLELTSYELISSNLELDCSLREKVNYILDRKGNVKIETLCREFRISRQALHKVFKKNLGISAKELAMIWRLNFFVTMLGGRESLTANAIDSGYFDQAHSINHFKKKWNLSPGIFQKSGSSLIQYAKESMDRRFSNFYDPEV